MEVSSENTPKMAHRFKLLEVVISDGDSAGAASSESPEDEYIVV